PRALSVPPFLSLFSPYVCPSLLLAPATSACSTLSLHDALPISPFVHRRSRRPHLCRRPRANYRVRHARGTTRLRRRLRTPVLPRSEEHTSELQSRFDLVCRLLLETKKKKTNDGKESTNTQETET